MFWYLQFYKIILYVLVFIITFYNLDIDYVYIFDFVDRIVYSHIRILRTASDKRQTD